MDNALIVISIVRVILTVAMLGYASYKDIKTREVSDAVWIVFGVAGLLIDGYEITVGTLSWVVLGVAIGFSILFSLLVGYLGFFGGADLLAFVVMGLLNPTPPLVGFAPLVFPSVLFPLTVISNSVLIGATSALAVLSVNMSILRNADPFKGYLKVRAWTRLLLLLTGRWISLKDVRGPPYEYPLESIEEDGSVSLQVRPDLTNDDAAFETISALRSKGRKYVWVSYSLPFLFILLLGFLSAVLLGDFSLWIVSRFL